MKHLLFCLLIGSFAFPAWSQEKEITLDEFIDKVGNAKPWTLEKLEAELGIKFEQTSLSEIYSGQRRQREDVGRKCLRGREFMSCAGTRSEMV